MHRTVEARENNMEKKVKERKINYKRHEQTLQQANRVQKGKR